MIDDTMIDNTKRPRIAGFIHIVSSIILSSIIPLPAYAGAWTQPVGHGQMIVTALGYRADTRYDDNGNRVSQLRYAKDEINPYFEYGATGRTTVGASLFITQADDGTDERQAIGDTELFLRYRLWQNDRYVVSIQPMVKLPSPMSDANDRPSIGSRSADLGVSLLAGTNFNLFGRSHYADTSLGYRYRFGEPEDQIQLAATVGLNVMERITLMPQVFQTIRISNNAANGFTQSPQDDYNLTRVQLSALYELDEKNTVQIGGFLHASGDNVGAGGGILVAYWRRF